MSETTTKAEVSPVDKFYAALSLRKLQATAKVRRRADVFHVEVPHTIGFGGSRLFKVRFAGSSEKAVKAVHALLRAPKTITTTL